MLGTIVHRRLKTVRMCVRSEPSISLREKFFLFSLSAFVNVRLFAAATLVGGMSVAHSAPQMILPGTPNVTGTGAFTYNVPIQIPPGTAGVVPRLSLSYSSQDGDGYEGWGWALNGLPAVTRCARNLTADGTHGSVNYDANDRLCFNGQQLLVSNSSQTYGVDGATYKTRIDQNYWVIEHGDITSASAWFEIKAASGLIMQFGNTTSSANSAVLAVGHSPAAVRTWLLSKATDRKGNYYTVSYNDKDGTDRTDLGEGYPVRIDYTGNATVIPAVSPYNSVQFSYESRTDSFPTYQAGSPLQLNKRLKDIKTYNGANLVLYYKLAYRNGTATLHSRLTSITLCDTSGTNCLPATTFDWQGGTAPSVSSATNNLTKDFSLLPGDFDADGLTDAVAYNFGLGTCPSTNAIFLGSSGFSPSTINTTYDYATLTGDNQNHHYDGPACFKVPPHFGDFNGDGFADAILDDHHWNESGTDAVDFSNALLNSKQGSIAQTNYDISSPQLAFYGDINGDGRMDGLVQTSSSGTAYFSDQGTWPFTPRSERTKKRLGDCKQPLCWRL